MAIDPAELLSAQGGPLDMVLFPGEQSNQVEARLQAYLDRAYADARVSIQQDQTVKDNLARAYALYLAFESVYLRMSAEPLSVQVTEKGGHGYSTEQIRNMKYASDKYLADFNGLLVVPGSTRNQRLGSMSIRNTVDF